MLAGIDQSVQQRATGWKIRRSNLGGGRDFSLPSEQALRHTQSPVQWVLGLFPEGTGNCDMTTIHPFLAPMLKKCRATLFLPLWALMTCSMVNETFKSHSARIKFNLNYT